MVRVIKKGQWALTCELVHEEEGHVFIVDVEDEVRAALVNSLG